MFNLLLFLKFNSLSYFDRIKITKLNFIFKDNLINYINNEGYHIVLSHHYYIYIIRFHDYLWWMEDSNKYTI